MKESRVAEAEKRHAAGYNCAQAVACTYCDLFGVDEETAYRVSEAFGFGMGSQDTCGALTGALMVAGLKNSGGMETPGKTKAATYKIAREMTQEFQDHVGSTLCREIKATPAKCSCSECIAFGAKLAEKHLLSNT